MIWYNPEPPLLHFLRPSTFGFWQKESTESTQKKYSFAGTKGTKSCDNHFKKGSESVGPSAVMRRPVPRFLFFWFVPKSIATFFFYIRKQAIQQELDSNSAMLICLLTQKAHFFSLFAMRASGMALLSISICKIGTEGKKIMIPKITRIFFLLWVQCTKDITFLPTDEKKSLQILSRLYKICPSVPKLFKWFKKGKIRHRIN